VPEWNRKYPKNTGGVGGRRRRKSSRNTFYYRREEHGGRGENRPSRGKRGAKFTKGKRMLEGQTG